MSAMPCTTADAFGCGVEDDDEIQVCVNELVRPDPDAGSWEVASYAPPLYRKHRIAVVRDGQHAYTIAAYHWRRLNPDKEG